MCFLADKVDKILQSSELPGIFPLGTSHNPAYLPSVVSLAASICCPVCPYKGTKVKEQLGYVVGS